MVSPQSNSWCNIQWNLTNPNSLGPELVQISEIFGSMKQYISMGELSLFYLLHTKITMNIIEMAVQINEGSD